MKILLIRHGKTRGNLERRYIGRTDEPLLEDTLPPGLEFPLVERVFTSPMLRCRQTAALIYPGREARVLDGLRECDFGDFEGKTYEELKDLPAYREWIGSGGKAAPPGGEPMEAFKARCCEAFGKALNECFREKVPGVAFIAHGGTIMSIMSEHAASCPARGFYDWQPPNLGGWEVECSQFVWVEIMTLRGAKPIGRKE